MTRISAKFRLALAAKALLLLAFIHAGSDDSKMNEVRRFESTKGLLHLSGPGRIDVDAQILRLSDLDPTAIDAKVAARTAAREARDFARADALRAELTDWGIELRDGVSATTWRAV